MFSFKKSLVLFSISNLVGYIIISSCNGLLVNSVVPDSPKPIAAPRKIPRKQCYGNCDCARYSHYDLPRSLKSFCESEERPPVPEKKNSFHEIPIHDPSKHERKGKKQGLVENPIYDTAQLTKNNLPFTTHPTKEHFYTSYGRPVEQDLYKVGAYDEPIYEEIDVGYLKKEHTPAGYGEHVYSEPYQLPVPNKTKYQKFKDDASQKLASLKKCAKNAFLSESKKPRDSVHKSKKGVTDSNSNLTKKSLGGKKVYSESGSEMKAKMKKATNELLREADKLESKLNEGSGLRHYGFNQSASSLVKDAKYKTDKELKKTQSGFSNMGKDLKAEARYAGKGAKAKLHGAKDKVSGGLDKFRNGPKKSAFKGSDSVKGYIADQTGDFGNVRPKPKMETFK
ncbi:hypothetical protein MACJ_000264 [Theileria orientalis]|uniref:Uncharacterized protein n=1 Tax=Theileria orientalis TaxID=68886 RepID=A0A976M3S2_THEOR|nr:hypothetical protein MACJ_000264 [Theileria orientalis]